MSRSRKIIYWIATLWLSLGMVSTGIVQLTGMKEELKFMQNLGYPDYILPMLGILKFAGVIIVLLPGTKLLKEYAYAGFFFLMAGAIYSHVAAGDPAKEILPALLLLVLTIISWYFRPDNRRIQTSDFSHINF